MFTCLPNCLLGSSNNLALCLGCFTVTSFCSCCLCFSVSSIFLSSSSLCLSSSSLCSCPLSCASSSSCCSRSRTVVRVSRSRLTKARNACSCLSSDTVRNIFLANSWTSCLNSRYFLLNSSCCSLVSLCQGDGSENSSSPNFLFLSSCSNASLWLADNRFVSRFVRDMSERRALLSLEVRRGEDVVNGCCGDIVVPWMSCVGNIVVTSPLLVGSVNTTVVTDIGSNDVVSKGYGVVVVGDCVVTTVVGLEVVVGSRRIGGAGLTPYNRKLTRNILILHCSTAL